MMTILKTIPCSNIPMLLMKTSNPPPSKDAHVHLHIAEIIPLKRRPIGRPAYNIPGKVNPTITKEYEIATPLDPKNIPKKNPVTMMIELIIPHFNNRSVRPKDIWSQPCVV